MPTTQKPEPASLTPREIVRELDKYIVGQQEAKRAVAIALRNRWRRLHAPEPLRNEIQPNNILLIGPTGVGKTEIARRLAALARAPFVKVEATRFTEVGYVGRDVESMVRDLVHVAVNLVHQEKEAEVADRARRLAEDRVLRLLFPDLFPKGPPDEVSHDSTVEHLRQMLREGKFHHQYVEVQVEKTVNPLADMLADAGIGEIQLNLPPGLDLLLPKVQKKRKLTVEEALRVFQEEEAQKLIDMDEVVQEALHRAETTGIVFIDELDKVAARSSTHGPDVSREGVQRDLLPIVEGTTVHTRYGLIKTDHILFIGAGAFHMASPQDLIPELQGRFPIRVELHPLTEQDFQRILVEPENALTKQYQALLAAEGVNLSFTPDAIQRIAHYAYEVNEKTENIGARRLHTVMSTLLEDLLFELPEEGRTEVVIDAAYVDRRLKGIVEDLDLSRYIL